MTQREALLAMYPDAGPAWREAIEAGIDVSLIERNLALAVERRLLQLDEMLRVLHTSTVAEEPPDATDDRAAAS